MKYICPTCKKEYDTSEQVAKCFLKCWKQENPHHKSKPAPRSENISVSGATEDVLAFFKNLEGADDNGRDCS